MERKAHGSASHNGVDMATCFVMRVPLEPLHKLVTVFPLGVEPQPILLVEVSHVRSCDTLFIASKTKHRQWSWGGYVTTNLSCFYLLLKVGYNRTRLTEDGRTIPIRIGID
jgi:hypothetical protein